MDGDRKKRAIRWMGWASEQKHRPPGRKHNASTPIRSQNCFIGKSNAPRDTIQRNKLLAVRSKWHAAKSPPTLPILLYPLLCPPPNLRLILHVIIEVNLCLKHERWQQQQQQPASTHHW